MSVLYKIIFSALFVSCGLTSIKKSADETGKPNNSWRVLVYGDAGDGDAGQIAVGKAMTKRHTDKSFDFAVSLGDNQYIDGENVFRKIFEIPYAELISQGMRFYQTIGNHDMESGRLAKQLQYSKDVDALNKNIGGWILPSEDYAFSFKETRFIVLNVASANLLLNTNPDRENFLKKELCEGQEKKKALFLHYPFFSTGPHGDHFGLGKKFLPLIESCPPTVVLSGHDHHAELFEKRQKTIFAVAGNGHEVRKFRRKSDLKSRFRSDDLGFLELEWQDGAEPKLCFRFIEIPDLQKPLELQTKEFCEQSL